MIKEIKKNRIDKEFKKILTTSEYTPRGTSIELIYGDVVIIRLDIIGKILTVFKKELVGVLGCDINNEIIEYHINQLINSAFKFLFIINII